MTGSPILPPALIFILGALVVPVLRGNARKAWVLLIPALGLLNLLGLAPGGHLHAQFLGHTLTLVHVDRMSLLFGYIFHMIGFIAALYAMGTRSGLELSAAFFYAGSALGVVFAGDLITLFCFWEMMTIGSVPLIWARGGTRGGERARGAGLRYALVHIAGGITLLFGITMHIASGGGLGVGPMGLGSAAGWLIFLGLGVNCAWPLLHNWLTDAYPEATIAGAVFLSAYTTKTAVYALARMYPGAGPLVWIGAAMAAFPIFYAVIENDLRRVLAYSLINQVGFMVVGIGIGTEMAINGALAHAFNDILFKGLLFMTMGAVMYRTGRINATDLGGLYRTMPWTCGFCIVGAASISAFPLFSGFVSKSMVMTASAREGFMAVWFILLFASAGVFHHAGIKIPFFAFFSRDSGLRPKEAPWNMLMAMGIAAALCVGIGCFPGLLYGILPYPVAYEPYTASHVTGQLQLLFFSALAFALLMLSGIYPAEMRAINLDADWLYRRGAGWFMGLMRGPVAWAGDLWARVVLERIPRGLGWFGKNPVGAIRIWLDMLGAALSASPARREELRRRTERELGIYPGDIIRHWPIGNTVLWVTAFLAAYLLLYY